MHFSSWSHAPAAGRHTVVDGSSVQLPSEPGTLHAWQSELTPPPQAVLQQTPSTQLPLEHCPAELHGLPFTSVGTHWLDPLQ